MHPVFVDRPTRQHRRADLGRGVGNPLAGQAEAAEGEVPLAGAVFADPLGGIRARCALPHLLEADNVGLDSIDPGNDLGAAGLPVGLIERSRVELHDPQHGLEPNRPICHIVSAPVPRTETEVDR